MNLKPEELKKEFLSVIHQVNDRYNLIQEKVDIIVGAVTHFIQSFQATVPSFEAKETEDKNQFAKLNALLAVLKEVVSKST